jgi:8-oxo-dGTP pyrophosphatase MutT (NUDIX family)
MKVICAGIFLVNNDNKLLVCHPTNHKPDFWSIPKGRLDAGETYMETAIRETYEECNITILETNGLRQLDSVEYTTKKKILYPFLLLERNSGTLDWSKFDFKCNSFVSTERGGFPEMDKWMWCPIDSVANLLHETQAICIPRIKEIIAGK